MTHEIENIKDCLAYMSEKQGLDILRDFCSDNRLRDNFETALSALIEHHGADSLTALAAVMRHYDLRFDTAYGELTITNMLDLLAEISSKNPITANDIKPEK